MNPLVSVGIDIGTTTVRAVALRVHISRFGERSYESLANSLCSLTPYSSDGKLEEEKILKLIDEWVEKEKLPQPDVGTLLFTGQAQRSPNCLTLSEKITSRWDILLSAQLDPDLESRVAAHGAGAVALSAGSLGTPVLHVDIGGGTSNFAWIENGTILEIACLDLGSRKWVLDSRGNILRRTAQAQVLESAFPAILNGGGRFDRRSAELFASVIAGLILSFAVNAKESVNAQLTVIGWNKEHHRSPGIVSVSGGIAECFKSPSDSIFRYGDIGPCLARAIQEEIKKRGMKLRLSTQEGRATALGISAYGFQLSGGSIHVPKKEKTRGYRNVPLYAEDQFENLRGILPSIAIHLRPECDVAFTSKKLQSYARDWIDKLHSKGLGPEHHVFFLLKENIAKSFGYFLGEFATKDTPRIWVLDEIELGAETSSIRSVDIGSPVDIGSSSEERIFVIIKTLKLF